MLCTFCGEDRAVPCRSTRDMEDRFIESGDGACFGALAELGGGERGLERVTALRDAIS
jgi:hypothetical protein